MNYYKTCVTNVARSKTDPAIQGVFNVCYEFFFFLL